MEKANLLWRRTYCDDIHSVTEDILCRRTHRNSTASSNFFFFYKSRSTLVGFCLFLIYLRQILIKLQKFVTIIADEQLSFFQMPMIIHTYIYYIHVHWRENISIIKFFQFITWVTDINQRFNQALCTLYISLLE